MFNRSVAALLFLILISGCVVSCKRRTVPTLAFYHWTIANSDDEQEQNVLHHFNSKCLYVKVMDVDWEDAYGAYPSTNFAFEKLESAFEEQLYHTLSLIPVIFITNKALEKTDSSDIEALAEKIVLKTEQLVRGKTVYNNNGVKNIQIDTSVKFNELQLDCDWTAKTKNKYFALLRMIKKLLPKQLISATLRLHQYKNPAGTGIPPVNELYLMCYNTGDIKKLEEKNSIFDAEKAKAYFENTNAYPVKLNFALPAFSWVIIFKHGQFYKIDNGIDENLFVDTLLTKKIGGNDLYELLADTVINNNFIRKGDLLKWEHINSNAMQQAAQLCSKAINSDSFRVVFYDIDHVKPTDYETIYKAFNLFRN